MAIPESAMKPTAAEMEKGISLRNSKRSAKSVLLAALLGMLVDHPFNLLSSQALCPHHNGWEKTGGRRPI
ncbi:hypothetical protein, partial [uncultured Alcanivorax sp.]|jgi:hypothetical protein